MVIVTTQLSLPLPGEEHSSQYEEAMDAIERAAMHFESILTHSKAYLMERDKGDKAKLERSSSHRAKASDAFRLFMIAVHEIPSDYTFPSHVL